MCADAAIDYGKMTIEHIGAQNPVGIAPLTGFATIGNLVFVYDDLNGKLNDRPFPEKKQIMITAKLPMDQCSLQQMTGRCLYRYGRRALCRMTP